MNGFVGRIATVAFIVLVQSLFSARALSAAPAEPSQPVESKLSFERHIRPILKAYCFDCHGGEEEIEAGLDLRLRRLMVEGGDSGPSLLPGDPDGSLFYQRIRDGEMPPRDKKVPPAEVEVIRRWVEVGAPTARDEPKEIGKGIGITEEDREFWSFRPIQRPDVPQFPPAARIRTPIDALIYAALDAKSLTLSPDADKLRLLRRVHLDVTGLPPRPDEIVVFLADDSPDAYENLVDRLLASRHYGERWGRHWLDVAGYADSEGVTESDPVRNFAYKYRDYVIRSLNTDKPFDQFVIEQLAGDELVSPPYDQLTPEALEKLTATGFLRMAADGTGSGAPDQEVARNQVIGDTIKIVSSALLGLTLGCAQCHDHRHDPILQADYYRVRAVFEPAYDWKNWRDPSQRRISLYTDTDQKRADTLEGEAGAVGAERAKLQKKYVAAALDKELEKFDESVRDAYRKAYYTPGDKRTPEQKQIFKDYPFLRIHGGNLYQYNQERANELKTYDEKMSAIRARKPFQDFIRVLTEVAGEVPVTYRFHRGDLKQPRDAIAPGGLTIAAPDGERLAIPENDPSLASTGRRLTYARWLTSGKHPLVARVLVNRVWMHFFGRGLVNTPSDFGVLGGRPSHPELLDWLASEFVESGWRLKHLHRLILTSTVYRQTSHADAEKHAIDPNNTLYWRSSVRRVEAEIIRDRTLATSGALNPKMYGPAVRVEEDRVGQIVVERPKSSAALSHFPKREDFRRSIYVQVRRSKPVGMLRQFDMPEMKVNCEKRTSSTVSTQSLMLMNGEFVIEQAALFAKRLVREVPGDRRAQVALAWLLAYSRRPTSSEFDRSLRFLEGQVEHLRSLEAANPSPNVEVAAKSTDDGEKKNDAKDTALEPLAPELQALTNLCQAVLGSSEFLYVD